MPIKVKNWEAFQHYSTRRPPWIKLYRELLDDPEFHELDGDIFKHLVMLWLIASEDKAMEGNLPPRKTLCFRMRINDAKLTKIIDGLDHWLDVCEQDDSTLPTDGEQHATPEEIREEREKRERERQSKDNYNDFINTYPEHRIVLGSGMEKAWKTAEKKMPDHDVLMASLREQIESVDWTKEGGTFVPNAKKWLKEQRWNRKVSKQGLLPVDTRYNQTATQDLEEKMRNKR